jgi:predicted nucleic acid-binding protein
MAIVVDTTVVIAVAGNEPSKPALVSLTRGEQLFAAGSLAWEVGNALAAMLKQRRVTVEQAIATLDQYRGIRIDLVDIDMKEALRLAANLGIYAYDAYVITCAQMLGHPMLTLDRRQRAAAQRIGVQVLEVKP